MIRISRVLIGCLLILQSACTDRGSEPVNGGEDTTVVSPVGKWQFLGLPEETVTAIAVDPNDARRVYVGTLYDFSAGRVGKLFKSTDCGQTWDTLLVGGGYSAVLIDPFNSSVVYALPGTVVKSTDGGRNWREIRNGILLDPETRAASIAMDPTNSSILYLGTGGFFGGTLYKSIDAGESWVKIWPDSLQDGAISIAIDPSNSSTIYAGTAWRGLLVKSIDAGSTWFETGLGERGMVHDICPDPREPSNLLVGVFEGVFYSDDGGLTWYAASAGLPSGSSVTRIRRSKTSSELYVIATKDDDGWVYQLNLDGNWERTGIETLRQSYYYSDFQVTEADYLYFGTRGGIFRMRLH